MDDRLVEDAVAALRAGSPVVLPTDTVYGLCAYPCKSQPVGRLSRLKRRSEAQPIALVASDVDLLLEYVPELRGRAATLARRLLPGPLTLVLPNPGARFRWLTGTTPEKIGVRVPELEGEARAILSRIGAVAATSANFTGEPDPRTLEDVPREIRDACAAVIDGGTLPGTPSTVVDFSGAEPLVLREGAVPAEEVLGRINQLVP